LATRSAARLEFVSHNVVRINRVGDWPSCARFGMLIAHLAEQHSNVVAEPLTVGDLQRMAEGVQETIRRRRRRRV
jgi:hypothetical protein